MTLRLLAVLAVASVWWALEPSPRRAIGVLAVAAGVVLARVLRAGCAR